jgi:hypothetical protein
MGWELTERWLSGAGGMERQQPIAFYALRSVLVVILYFQKVLQLFCTCWQMRFPLYRCTGEANGLQERTDCMTLLVGYIPLLQVLYKFGVQET